MISLGMLRDVWAFRGFILGSIQREFQSRYRGTQFGILWLIANPLAMILIYTVVFAKLMKPSLPNHSSEFAYSIYLCAGIFAWNIFYELVSRTVNVFVENAGLLKKVSFPKLCLPLIVLGSSWLNFSIILFIFLVFLILISAFPGWIILAGLPLLILLSALAMGVGMLLATINVFYRDIAHSTGIVLQFWFWLTPIVYVASVLPAPLQAIFGLNPMLPIVQGFQTLFVDQMMPQWNSLVYPTLLATGFLLFGILAFYRLQGEIVDEL